MRAGEHECMACWKMGFPNQGAVTMDGLTGSQWRKRERWEEEHAQAGEEADA
jgi:hypothetical protein